MKNGDILILKGNEVFDLLKGREHEIVKTIKLTYEAHARGESSLPHSNFLRFPHNARNRIIALPAYLGGQFEVAGIKWIASFPSNLDHGMERASAILVLNSTETGRPQVIMESSVISAQRTAASAALAAHCLRGDRVFDLVGLVGCGLINFEILRFLYAALDEIETIYLYDINRERAEQFAKKCLPWLDGKEIVIAHDRDAIFQNASLISLATTAAEPHIFDTSHFHADALLLHISLRDLSPDIIRSAVNVVDDIDHVCRAQTSLHLAEQCTGNRQFIRCTLGDILTGVVPSQGTGGALTVFSPFGLGILDIALAQYVYRLSTAQKSGTAIESFFPTPWQVRA